MPGRLGQSRHALDGGGTGADDPDPLVGQPVQIRAGVAVVPTAGVEGAPGELVDAGDTRQLRLLQVTVGHGYESGPECVASIGGDHPARCRLFPTDFGDLGLQAGVAVQVVVAGDALTVREDLRTLGVFLGRHVTEFLQQRHVDVGLHVTGDAGIPIPVPGAADVGRLVDQANTSHAEFTQPGAGQQSTESGSDDRDVDFVGQRFPGVSGVGPGVVREPGEVARHLDVLVDPVVSQAPLAFPGVLVAQGIRIKVLALQILDVGHYQAPPERRKASQQRAQHIINQLIISMAAEQGSLIRRFAAANAA